MNETRCNPFSAANKHARILITATNAQRGDRIVNKVPRLRTGLPHIITCVKFGRFCKFFSDSSLAKLLLAKLSIVRDRNHCTSSPAAVGADKEEVEEKAPEREGKESSAFCAKFNSRNFCAFASGLIVSPLSLLFSKHNTSSLQN